MIAAQRHRRFFLLSPPSQTRLLTSPLGVKKGEKMGRSAHFGNFEFEFRISGVVVQLDGKSRRGGRKQREGGSSARACLLTSTQSFPNSNLRPWRRLKASRASLWSSNSMKPGRQIVDRSSRRRGGGVRRGRESERGKRRVRSEKGGFVVFELVCK